MNVWKLPWTHDPKLSEAVRLERGKLAAAVVKNDRVRNRLDIRVRETPISDMLQTMLAKMDARRD